MCWKREATEWAVWGRSPSACALRPNVTHCKRWVQAFRTHLVGSSGHLGSYVNPKEWKGTPEVVRILLHTEIKLYVINHKHIYYFRLPSVIWASFISSFFSSIFVFGISSDGANDKSNLSSLPIRYELTDPVSQRTLTQPSLPTSLMTVPSPGGGPF